LAAYGHFDLTRPEQPGQIRVGIVGTPEAIDNSLNLLEEISQSIEQEANIDCVLHPSFPGMNSQEPFRIHLVTQSQWHRPLHKTGFRSLKQCEDSNTRRWFLQEAFGGEVRALSELENPPQVILCALSEPVTCFLSTESARDDSDSNYAAKKDILWTSAERSPYDMNREFRAGLKAECMGTLPTEIIGDQGYSKIGVTQDRATRAWKLSLALLHKAGLVPWRLANSSEDSCYVGISVYRPAQSLPTHILRSFAHVVTELGDGFIVHGEAFEWDPAKEGNTTAHLDEGQANRLLSSALAVFTEKLGCSPRKVVVHKTTPYSSTEHRGFENALHNVPQYGLLTISRRGIFCVRPGRKPILRGTAIPFDEKLGLVFASGYVPFLRACSRYKVPQPLEITENWGSLSFQHVARDLIRLTKLDLDSPDFCTDFPITLAGRQKIGDVLRESGRIEPSRDDKYYI
jgi:hypothetical protein